MVFSGPHQPWYEDYDNIVLVVRHMADEGFSPRQIAEVVEKPWKYESEYRAAKAAKAREARR